MPLCSSSTATHSDDWDVSPMARALRICVRILGFRTSTGTHWAPRSRRRHSFQTCVPSMACGVSIGSISLTSFLIMHAVPFRVCQQSKKANFDASHELEELLLEDNPLKARQRKVQDINNLSAEMRQMEEQ